MVGLQFCAWPGTFDKGQTVIEVAISPLPPGKQFGMTFVDDTDLSTRANTEPVYDVLAEHGFWGTKTVWPLRPKRTSSFRREDERPHFETGTGDTLEDEDYLAFIRRLKTQGFEIALHGIAAGNSTRQEIEAGLALFRQALDELPTMNAFHRTNIENLYCGVHKLDSRLLRLLEQLVDRSAYEGHREGTPAFWGDIAHETFRYVRLPFHTIDEINTLRVNPSMPFRDSRRPYVRRWFAASDGADALRFNRLLSESNVERLARERGISIVYTHFAKGFARPGANGHVADQEFVRTVARVTAHPGAWFTTATEMMDRLETVHALAVEHRGHELVIHNTRPQASHQVTLLLPSGETVRRLDDAPLDTGAGALVIPSLPPDGRLALVTSWAGRQRIAATAPTITRRERRGIEYRNYIGLVRGWARDRAHWRRQRTASTPHSTVQA